MERITRIAEMRAEQVAGTVATAIDIPGIRVTREAGRIVLEGRGLTRRAMTDARLRGLGLWIGGGR